MYFGPQRDGARDADALAHAARQLGGKAIVDAGQVDEVERLVDARRDLALVELALLAQSHGDVLADGERVEQRGELEDVADARAQRVQLAPRQLGHVEAVDPDLARVGLEQSDDVLDRDRLSGARVADDDHRLALGDVEGEALEDALGAEGFVDVDELDHELRVIGERASDVGRPSTAASSAATAEK